MVKDFRDLGLVLVSEVIARTAVKGSVGVVIKYSSFLPRASSHIRTVPLVPPLLSSTLPLTERLLLFLRS